MKSPLQEHLTTLPAGPVNDPRPVEYLLADHWRALSGSRDGGMKPHKIPGRTEGMAWDPPVLTFTIERHGGTALGSTRAELQNWKIDTAAWRAEIVSTRRRQLTRAAAPVRMQPLAEAIADAILTGSKCESIKRLPDGRVRVLISVAVPDGQFKQTTTSRRKRFRSYLEPLLAAEGWEAVGINTYQHISMAHA